MRGRLDCSSVQHIAFIEHAFSASAGERLVGVGLPDGAGERLAALALRGILAGQSSRALRLLAKGRLMDTDTSLPATKKYPTGPAAPFWPPDLPEVYYQKGATTRKHPTTGAQHEVLPATATCNGYRSFAETYCKRPAGWDTDHPGTGRCRHHDGARLATAARIRLGHIAHTAVGALALELEATDSDPTDITAELHLARSLLLNWIQRYDTYMEQLTLWARAYASGEVGHPPPLAMDMTRIDGLLRRVADLALQLQHAKLRDAISQGEMIEILRAVSRVVEESVTTCPQCAAPLAGVLDLIRAGWQKVSLWKRPAPP